MYQTSKLNRLIASADAVINAKGGVRVNGKPASLRTIQLTRETLHNTCRRLHKMGFYLEDIQGLSAKHINAVVRNWYDDKLSPKSMQNMLSRLRVFSVMLGKRGIVREGGLPAFLPEVDPKALKVKTYTEASKSWTGKAVDTLKVIDKAFYEDMRLYIMLLLEVFFGLRRKEVLRLKPNKIDRVKWIEIDGSVAKGGRYRVVHIFDDDVDPTVRALGQLQRKVLNMAKKLCTEDETLGWPGRTYQQCTRRYHYLLTKLGVTKAELGIVGHGLRAEFGENGLLILGVVPPVLGGNGKGLSPAKRKEVLNSVASSLGHNDTHTSAAYYGSFTHPPSTSPNGAAFTILSAEELLEKRVGKLCSYAFRLV